MITGYDQIESIHVVQSKYEVWARVKPDKLPAEAPDEN